MGATARWICDPEVVGSKLGNTPHAWAHQTCYRVGVSKLLSVYIDAKGSAPTIRLSYGFETWRITISCNLNFNSNRVVATT